MIDSAMAARRAPGFDSMFDATGYYMRDTVVRVGSYELSFIQLQVINDVQFRLSANPDSVIEAVCSETMATADTLRMRCDGGVLGPVLVDGHFADRHGHYEDSAERGTIVLRAAVTVGSPPQRLAVSFRYFVGD